MWIPLARFGNDESPIAWWEWLFVPVMMPLFLVFFLIMAVLSVPYEYFYQRKLGGEEKQLALKLTADGRSMEWDQVEAKLRSGDGTLVVEHCSPKGPVREWWVSEDLVALAPVPLPTSIRVPPPDENDLLALRSYAKDCSTRYLNIESGSACITAVPVPVSRKSDARKYVTVNLGAGLMTAIILELDRKLLEKFPQGRVVTMLAWSDEPLLFRGDAETVFLPPKDPTETTSDAKTILP